MSHCKICGEWDCQEHLTTIRTNLKRTFSGSSPPEIFVGKWGYPNVYAGLLAPEKYGDTQEYTSPESWYSKSYPIEKIKSLRTELLYGRTTTSVKNPSSRIMQTVKEVAMSHKATATEMTLKKPIFSQKHEESSVPLMTKAAQIENVRLEENPRIDKNVDYLVNDTDVKAKVAIEELYKSKTQVSTIMKILSAGLLGQGSKRKLVPTKWSITAVDSALSLKLLEKVKNYQELHHIELFHNDYLGNHYEFLLLPGPWSFEVIEVSHTGMAWMDYESNFSRKKYAESVTGAYYANRLAVAEYLSSIQRQATVLVLREIRPEYNTPCGVGILRECSRAAFNKKPSKFNTQQEAYLEIQSRLNQALSVWLSKSTIMKTYGQQKKITQFI